MLVKELMYILSSCEPNDRVSILIQKPFTTIGGTPVAEIKSVSVGFDWDKGKVMIVPENKLWEVDPENSVIMKTLNDKLGWCEYEKSGLKTQIKKLKKEMQNEQ